MCFLHKGGKLIIFSGIPNDDVSNFGLDQNKAEVIDLLNEDLECDSVTNGHNANIIGASGGRIKEDFVYCGGSFDSMYNDPTSVCRILGKGYPEDPLHSPLNITMVEGRCNTNGGVVLPNNTLFIGGKYIQQ